MTKTFDEIVNELSASDFDILKGFILDTVRAEFAPLIDSLATQSYEGESDSEPTNTYKGENTENRADEDQAGEPIETGETFSEFLEGIGLAKPKRNEDQHLRFHALQMALAWLSTDGNSGEPVVLANLFYGFLKGDA
jgi:hypothetical protein